MPSHGRKMMQIASVAIGALSVLNWAQSSPQKRVPPPNTKLIRSVEGADLFRAHCAACHGTDAKGNGPVAPLIKVKTPDLTTIAQRNHGVFSSARVLKIISGDEVLAAHGSRAMPIWGPIFHQVERDQDWGEPRLDNLVKYLKSIQQR